MKVITAGKNNNLTELFNTVCDETLCVILPENTVFEQKVTINRDNLIVVGSEGSVIRWNDHNGMVPGFGTADSATVTIRGSNVKLIGITVENSFDYPAYKNGGSSDGMGLQAVAVFISPESENVAFTDCRLLGWQDTLFADGRNCSFVNTTVEGCVDFIFGSSDAVFINCDIVSRASGFVTAPSTKSDSKSGLCFISCTFSREKGVEDGSVYIARPWHPGGRSGVCSSVSIEKCTLSEHVNRKLWTTMRDSKGVVHTPAESRFSIDSFSVGSLSVESFSVGSLSLSTVSEP